MYSLEHEASIDVWLGHVTVVHDVLFGAANECASLLRMLSEVQDAPLSCDAVVSSPDQSPHLAVYSPAVRIPLRQVWHGRAKVADAASAAMADLVLFVTDETVSTFDGNGEGRPRDEFQWSTVAGVKFSPTLELPYVIFDFKHDSTQVTLLPDTKSSAWNAAPWSRLVFIWRTLRDLPYDVGYTITELTPEEAIDHHTRNFTSIYSKEKLTRDPTYILAPLLKLVLAEHIAALPTPLSAEEHTKLASAVADLSEKWIQSVLADILGPEKSSQQQENREKKRRKLVHSPENGVSAATEPNVDQLPLSETTVVAPPVLPSVSVPPSPTPPPAAPPVTTTAATPLPSPPPSAALSTTLYWSQVGPPKNKLIRIDLDLDQRQRALVAAAQGATVDGRLRVQLRCIPSQVYTTNANDSAVLISTPIGWPTRPLSVVANINDLDYQVLSPPREGPDQPVDITKSLATADDKKNRVTLTVTGDRSDCAFMIVFLED